MVYKKINAKRTVEMQEIDVIKTINAKVDKLFVKLDQLSLNVVQFVQVYELCGGHHATSEC